MSTSQTATASPVRFSALFKVRPSDSQDTSNNKSVSDPSHVFWVATHELVVPWFMWMDDTLYLALFY